MLNADEIGVESLNMLWEGVMETMYSTLERCMLFRNIEQKHIREIVRCLAAREREYRKNAFIFSMDDPVREIGVILSGGVQIMKEDFWGNRGIYARLGPGEVFGEAFSCARKKQITVNVLAVEPTRVLFVDSARIIRTCSSACAFHTRLIDNLIVMLAEKNMMLTRKIEHSMKRTTREKLLSYLSEQAMQQQCSEFDIPFNRQELADYLSVDRSAMSNELCRMRDRGEISFNRNHFILHREIEE